jgi:hypothetical protein
MKVKVGNTIYDSAEEAVMVILEPQDKKNIANMPEHFKHYCMYPDHLDPETIKAWMQNVGGTNEAFF